MPCGCAKRREKLKAVLKEIKRAIVPRRKADARSAARAPEPTSETDAQKPAQR